MKRTVLILLAFVAGNFAIAQETQTRDVQGFTGIEVANGIELTLKKGSTESVEVSASKTEYRDRIKTVVENGVLKLYMDKGQFWKGIDKGNKALKAFVTVIKLESLKGSSGSTTLLEGDINSEGVEITMSSGSTVKGSISGSGLTVSLNSGATAKISGTLENMTVKSSSGSHFYGYDLVTKNCTAEVSSGAKIEITVNSELSAKAHSGGVVVYKGACSVKSVNIGSGGAVKNKS